MILTPIKNAITYAITVVQIFCSTLAYENDPNRPLYTKEELLSVLGEVYESDQVVLGTQMLSSSDMVSKTLKQFYDASGQYPGILGIDINAKNLSVLGKNGMKKVVTGLKEYAQSGGIITISIHFSNPKDKKPYVDNYRGYLGGNEKWAELVTKGSELNESFMIELELVGDFLELLDEAEIPVIFRPLHESNANWFWFSIVQNMNGINQKISEESFKNLWIYIHDYLTKEREITNLIWEFSPNIGTESSWMVPTLYGYPGDEYVDICGFDWYTSDGDPTAIDTHPTYQDLKTLGMMINLTEFGPGSKLMAGNGQKQEDLFSSEDMLGFLEYMKNNGYNIGYAMTWHGPYSCISMGKLDVLMQSDITLGQAELYEMFKKNK